MYETQTGQQVAQLHDSYMIIIIIIIIIVIIIIIRISHFSALAGKY
jgi:hypothetical protein